MTKTVLPPEVGAGPLGLGDPDDRKLRKVEREILIPQIMRERTRLEKCIPETDAYAKCCKDAGLLMTFKCKQETNALTSCMEKWYHDEEFKRECTEEYLEKRRQFRLTGERKKIKAKEAIL